MDNPSTFNYKVVRQFAIMTVVWGIVGMLVGVIIAAQLLWPEILPAVRSRGVLFSVAHGSVEYSAVTQPVPEFLRKSGTFSSIVAAATTLVLPISM